MRLFIAVDFNELKECFVELQKLLPKNAKLSLTKSFHITLKFLGEVRPDKVSEIVSNLKAIKTQPFTVFLGTIGVFPTENYIRIVWVDIKPEDRIIELQKQIDSVLSKLFKKEKNFKAHITLARVKYLEDKKQFLKEFKKIKIEKKKIEIKEFRLLKSTLTTKGPFYEDLVIFSL